MKRLIKCWEFQQKTTGYLSGCTHFFKYKNALLSDGGFYHSQYETKSRFQQNITNILGKFRLTPSKISDYPIHSWFCIGPQVARYLDKSMEQTFQ